MPSKQGGKKWNITREKVLFVLGVAVLIFEVVNAEVLGRPFHVEFLMLGLTLCGASVFGSLDRK